MFRRVDASFECNFSNGGCNVEKLIRIQRVFLFAQIFFQFRICCIQASRSIYRNFVSWNVACSLILFFFDAHYYSVLPVDMASKYASLVSSLGTAAMASGAILSPIVMGLIVTDHVCNSLS